MATVREQSQPTAPVRNDAVVQGQLDRVRRRIRNLDLTAAGLGLAALTLGFALLVVLLDSTYQFSAPIRQLILLGYVLTVIGSTYFTLVRPLTRRVNAYYAARKLEQTLPEAKNSLVNWLDLHEQPLAPVIRGALAQRAARDLGKTDLDQVVDARPAILMGGLLLTAFLGLGITLIWLGGGALQVHLGRAFFPFGQDALAKRTQLTLVRPVQGDAIVAIGQSVSIAVEVAGRIPDPSKADALKLYYRYAEDDPYEEQLLEPEVGELWSTVIPASRTHQGFLYKVVGGDDETPEHRITVRSGPLVESYEVTYRYRPYLGWADRTVRDANLKELRGTEALLLVRTNREVKEGRLELEDRTGKRELPADLIPDDPRALRFRLVLDQDGQYRVGFTSVEGEKNAARTTFTITVLPDRAPRVELTKPGADITLPANGTLNLEGHATDDFGLQGFKLHLRVADGATLAPRAYREGVSFQLIDGSYPRTLEYKDFVALDQLKDEAGKPFATAKGMVLEYWLVATDSCDFPGPNHAESKHFKVTLTEPDANAKRQQEERQKAEEDQKGHEKQQDAKQDGENKEREGGGGGANPEEKPREGGGEGGDPLERKAEEIREALDRQANETKGEAKGEGQRPEGDPMGQPGEKCECKGGGQGDGTGEAGEARPQGMGDGGPGEEGTAKGAGQSADGEGTQGESKGEGRPGEKQDRQDTFGESKSPPSGENQPNGGSPCAECKGGNGAEANGAGACKGGGSGEGQGQGEGQGTARGAASGQNAEGNGQAKATGVGQGGQGQRGQERRADGTGAAQQEQRTREGGKGDDAHRRRAGVLQLEDLNKLDRKLLQELKMSEDDLKAFRDALARKRARPTPTPETLPASQSGNLRNLGAREIKPGDKPQTHDARRTGLGQAPPEFREAFRQYTTGDK